MNLTEEEDNEIILLIIDSSDSNDNQTKGQTAEISFKKYHELLI